MKKSHPCEWCGAKTTNPKYCSLRCSGRGISKTPWTDVQLALLCELWPSHHSGELAPILGHSKVAIQAKATLLRLPHRKIKPDETLFDEWTQQAAYVAGYIAADGTIAKSSGAYCRIQIASTDLEHLKILRRCFGIDRERNIYAEGPPIDMPTAKIGYKLCLSSRCLCEQLMRIGITPKKSLTLKYPIALPATAHQHFIRGYGDGDGSIFITKRGDLYYSLAGTREFLQGVVQIISEQCGVSCPSVFCRPHSQLHTVTYCTRATLKVLPWLYNGAEIYLERKFAVYIEFLKMKGLLRDPL